MFKSAIRVFDRSNSDLKLGLLYMDTLSDVLNSVRFKGAMYGLCECAAPWGIRMPDAQGHVRLFAVVRGGCLIQFKGERKPISLAAGELVLCCKDLSCDVTDAPGSAIVPIEKIAEQVSSLMVKLETTVDSVNNGILTDQNKKSVQEALEGFAAVGTDLKEGRGTLGKLLTDESIYNNLDDLTSDLKGNPWKLLYRPKPVS